MSGSVQLCAKERFHAPGDDETFVRLGFTAVSHSEEAKRDEAKAKLRDIVVSWIESDNGGRSTPDVAPDTIVGALTGRVCHIAGHVWLEYGSCDLGHDVALHVVALNGSGPTCGGLAEFLPRVEQEIIAPRVPNQGVLWTQLTVDFVWDLVSPLFAGEIGVPGEASLYQPNEIESMPPHWLHDRGGAWVTPLWTATGSLPAIDGQLRYSYRPDVTKGVHNCLTWAAAAMDGFVDPGWIVPLLRDGGGTVEDETMIRQTGRMSHFAAFASKADAVRTSHPRY